MISFKKHISEARAPEREKCMAINAFFWKPSGDSYKVTGAFNKGINILFAKYRGSGEYNQAEFASPGGGSSKIVLSTPDCSVSRNANYDQPDLLAIHFGFEAKLIRKSAKSSKKRAKKHTIIDQAFLISAANYEYLKLGNLGGVKSGSGFDFTVFTNTGPVGQKTIYSPDGGGNTFKKPFSSYSWFNKFTKIASGLSLAEIESPGQWAQLIKKALKTNRAAEKAIGDLEAFASQNGIKMAEISF